MGEKNMSIEEWGVVKAEIARNKQKRINWKEYFGDSIGVAVRDRKRLGYSNNRVKSSLRRKLVGVDDEIVRRFNISVSARLCEYQRDVRE
jgi:hypothetical protein